ncbi:unnamed protein product, partial [Didymodactylos carnosus]
SARCNVARGTACGDGKDAQTIFDVIVKELKTEKVDLTKILFCGFAAFKDGSVPFWTFGGSAIASEDQVRVTPSIRSQRGWIWSKNTLGADNWVLDVKLRVTGRGRIGADGMAIWFTEQAGVEGPVFGSNDQWKGLGIFLDSFDNDALLYVNNGLTQDDNAFEFCTRVEQPNLPKIGYLGVSAATGGLADDHDVLEFLSYSYVDKQSMANQATDEQMKKYREEYEKYEEDLKKQREDYRKDHPDATPPVDEKSLYESEYDREFRTILEGQDQIRFALTNIDRKMAEMLGRVERLQGTNQPVPTGIQGGGNIPSDVARVQDINRVITSHGDITRTVQSLSQILSDLQQKVTYLQTQASAGGKVTGTINQGGSLDNTALNEIKDALKVIKQETGVLMQRGTIKCPTSDNGTCMGPFLFLSIIVVQCVVIIGYFIYNQEAATAASPEKDQADADDKKLKQQKYQELEKMKFRPLYLDAQATTPMDPRVLDSMLPFMTHLYGNPHSRTHAYGWESEKAVEESREKVARLIGADAKEIIFTSGATESNNIAVKGVARFYKEKKKHVITTQTEHKCVLDSCRVLESEGFKVTYLPVQQNGLIDLQQLESVLTPDTSICSIMTVNNEIGVRQPVKEIGKLCRSKKVFFHTDAAQAVGKIPLNVNDMNIDLMSISGHKLYGPKGIGALYIRRRPRVRIDPIQTGGGQERNVRSGTVPTPLVVGLGTACQLAEEEMSYDQQRISKLAKRLIDGLSKRCTNVILNGDAQARYDGCVNLSFAYIEGESLLMALKDIALSSGSACTSASLEPSYVLRAIGADDDLAHSSIRFGIGRFSTEQEIDYTIEKTVEHVKRLREMSPLWEMVQEGIDIKSIKWSQH